MKRLWLMTLFAALGSAVAAQTVTVPLLDTSGQRSPIQYTGTCKLSEVKAEPGYVGLARDLNGAAKNNSNVPLVALIETISMTYPGGERGVVVERYDGFFGPTIIPAHGTLPLWGSSSRVEELGNSAPPNGARKPNCEIKLEWAQFADGNTYGGSEHVAQFLADRAAAWKALTAVDAAYRTGGKTKFLAALEHRYPGYADGYIDHLRMAQRQKGTEAAISALQAHLAFATKMAAKLTPRPQN